MGDVEEYLRFPNLYFCKPSAILRLFPPFPKTSIFCLVPNMPSSVTPAPRTKGHRPPPKRHPHLLCIILCIVFSVALPLSFVLDYVLTHRTQRVEHGTVIGAGLTMKQQAETIEGTYTHGPQRKKQKKLACTTHQKINAKNRSKQSINKDTQTITIH